MLEAVECNETVSIIEAVLFGAEGACVDIGLTSLLGGVALFIGSVLVLRFVGNLILRRIFPSLYRKNSKSHIEVEIPLDGGLQRLPYESPIRSTGAWGSKLR